MSGKKGRKNDVPSNFNDKCRNAYTADASEVKLKPKSVDKPSKTLVSSGIEDHRIKPKIFDRNQSAEPNPHNNVLKVEMQTLRLSKDLENMMMDTLRFLYGENFALKSKSDYSDKGSNLGRQYWIDQGGLVVLGGVDYSQKNRKKTFAELSAFAISKLEIYGFHNRHCIEALQATDGDLGASLELLMIRYFHLDLPLPVKNSAKPPPTSPELIEQRRDEVCSLESIFEQCFEVRIADRVWVLKLDLPYLNQLYPDKKVRNSDHHSSDLRNRGHSKDAKKGGKKNEICNAFAQGKVCKFGQNCRFLHQKPELKSTPDETAEDNHFFLEVRFPPGCKYPLDVPLVCFSASASHFPPAVCLRLTSHLMKEAKELSLQEIPSVYSLASLLQYQSEEILDYLQTIGEAFLSPSVSLFEASGEEAQNGDVVEDTESRDDLHHSHDLSKKQRKASLDITERIREDEKLIRKFSEKQRTGPYRNSLAGRSKLPAWNKMEEILETVARYQVVVISGETGCGKSTQVPQYILDDWMLHFEVDGKKRCEIICTQPRRISAIGVAERVAEERLDNVGNTIGYQIRLESKMSQSTRLLFCTTGILLRRLEREPDLRSVTHIVVDEVHERSEESDFLLMILKELLPKRPDLRVILMSATMDAKLFSDYFNKIPVITIPGRTFPVQKIFLDEVLELTDYVLEEDSQYARKLPKEKRKMDDKSYDGDSLDIQLVMAEVNANQVLPKDHVRDEMLTLGQLQLRYSDCSSKTIKSLYLMDVEKINYDLIESVLTWIVDGDHDHPRRGSILVFLPGIAEIMTLHKQLTNHPLFGQRSDRFLLVPLHSTLTSEEQSLVFRKCKESVRKIVLSTNIAETSITIDDCVYVIDSGRMKEKRFDSNKNMESLEVDWVTKANASQRRGRAGRVMPGVCIHLYSKHRHDFNFMDQPIPEIHRVPLDQLILRIKVLPNFQDRTIHQVLCGVIEAPDSENIETGVVRLQNIGALDSEQDLTPLGHHLALLPVDVRIGKLMLFGAMFCCVDSVLTIAACLSYKSPFVAPFAKRDEAQAKKKDFSMANSDHLTVLKAYTSWRKKNAISKTAGDVFANENYLSWRTLVTIADIKYQFLELLVDIGFVPIELRRRKSGVDNVLDFTGNVLNEHGENQKLLAAILYAALYPNLVKVLTPAKTFAPSILGAIPKQFKPEELRFQTMRDGYVFVHPSSVTHTVSHFPSPYLVFTEKVKTSRIFIRDCSMVPMLPLVLFTGKPIKVELHRGTFVISLDDGWIMFSVESHQLAELLQIMREELKKLLGDKIRDPTLNLQQSPRGKKIISTIVALITQG